MSGAGSPPRPRAEQLRDFVAGARWFGGKGRPFEVTDVRRLWLSQRADARVAVELLTLAYADGGSDVYQLPLAYRSPDGTQGGAGDTAARVGTWEDPEIGPVVAHDALQDPESAALWLDAFTGAGADAASEELRFHRVPETALGTAEEVAGWSPKLLRGEQSNTSVVFGDRALLKVFRRLEPGQNPDIEILSALTSAGSPQVAPLYGWVETSALGTEPVQLGILQQFLVGAHDGWVLALDDLAAASAGPESFAAQAAALGDAVGRMHAALASSFPTERWQRPELARVADAMAARLEAALPVVPDLAGHAGALTALFDGVRRLEQPVVAQRVHGDLHLGQTLWRQDDGWKIIDFEGEPAKSLAERRSPDCALRDVAGMLRSFDYAAESARRTAAGSGLAAEGDDRPRQWATVTSKAFLDGYGGAVGAGSGSGLDPVLLRAYEADKAVYEAVYEARNRPAWLPIPLAALSRLTDRPPDATDRPVSAVRGGA
jgi:maltokinase